MVAHTQTKVFIKPFEAPQRSVKIKVLVNFFSSSGIGTGRVKNAIRFASNTLMSNLISIVPKKVSQPKWC